MTAQPSARQVIRGYAIERELGRGGMGAVYLGRNALGVRVAIKVLLPVHAQHDDLRRRFFAEARTVGMIEHASIVKVFDYGVTDDDRTYIVMEYLEGESLAARLKARGRLPIPQAVAIARQVATALAAAHARGVVHRDLKPDNIFLVRDPEVVHGERAKLLDFGVAKLIADDDPHIKTVTGAILGTPQYMSPEQCEGARSVDARSDLYSLGCTLYQMVSGRCVFESAGVGGLIGMHLHVPPPKLREHAPYASSTLEAIVARLLEKDPAARFASGTELAAALADPDAIEVDDTAASTALPQHRVDGAQPTAVSRVTPRLEYAPTLPSPAPPPRTRRSRWPLVTGSLAIAGVVAAVVALATRDRDPLTSTAASVELVDAATSSIDAALAIDPEDEEGPDDGEEHDVSEIENVLQLVEQKDWIRAGVVAAALEPSLEPTERHRLGVVLEAAAPEARRWIEREVIAMSIKGQCGAAQGLVEQFTLGWGDANARDAARLAEQCRKRDETRHAKEIIDRYAAGEHLRAFDLCRLQVPKRAEPLAYCVVAACAMADKALAVAWAKTLQPREIAVARCRELHGMVLDDALTERR